MDQAVGVIISAAIAAVISVIVNISSIYFSRRKMYAETASVERINWIRKLRESTIELISLCETYDSLDKEQQLVFNKAKTSIIIHLNPSKYGYGNDNVLYGLIADKSFDDIKANRNEIERLVSTICKDEWDKVKIESGRTESMRRATKQK